MWEVNVLEEIVIPFWNAPDQIPLKIKTLKNDETKTKPNQI